MDHRKASVRELENLLNFSKTNFFTALRTCPSLNSIYLTMRYVQKSLIIKGRFKKDVEG